MNLLARAVNLSTKVVSKKGNIVVFGLKSEPTITMPLSRINGMIDKSISLSPILCVMVSGTTLEITPERVDVPVCVVVSLKTWTILLP